MTNLVQQARAALEGVTPGPWEWGGYPNDLKLQTVHHGKTYVMDFVRKGFSSAQPRFQPNGHGMVNACDLLQFQVGDQSIVGESAAQADQSVYRYDVRGVDAPDARFIAASRDLVPAMADEIERLRAALAQALVACRIVDDVAKAGHETLGSMVAHFLEAIEPARAALREDQP